MINKERINKIISLNDYTFVILKNYKVNIMYKVYLFLFILSGFSFAQQIGDPDFNPPIFNPAYAIGEGSWIYIDEAHNNFHTKDERYKPFADLLTRDGYVVKALRETIGRDTLDSVDILVISNALNIRNIKNWTLPTPSAFTEDEIEIIVRWVDEGGSLFLIADHMPFPGAVLELASQFGFQLNNGFAFDTSSTGFDLFTRKAGTLKNNLITNGRDKTERVDSVYSFTGEAFQIPKDAVPVMTMNNNFISI